MKTLIHVGDKPLLLVSEDFEEKINNIKKKKPIKSEDLHIISFFHKDILEKTASLIEAVETVPIELNAGAQIIQRQSNIHNTLSKLLDKNNDEVSYSYIKVPFEEFNTRLGELKKDGKITEYIDIE